MSEIQRYTTLRFVKDGSVVMTPDHHGGYVRFTDHEAAVEQVLADATARIEGLKLVVNTGPSMPGHDETESDYNRGLDAALAAFNQPQTEGCEDCYVSALSSDEPPCPVHGGGSGQGPSGVAEADLEGEEPSESEAVARVKAVMKAGRDAGSGVFDSHSVFRFGTHGVAALLNFLERDGWEVIHTGVYAQPGKWIAAEEELEDSTGTAPQRPKADPKEVHSCHADCPCQSGGEPLRDFVAPVPHTEGEKAFTGRLACPDCGASLRFVSGQDDLQCPDCGTGKGNK